MSGSLHPGAPGPRAAGISAGGRSPVGRTAGAAVTTTAFADTSAAAREGSAASASADQQCFEPTHPFGFPQPEDTSTFFAMIEIPQDSITKYEVDVETGQLIVDRFQSMPVAYPGNYGSIPRSQGGDGDPLDVLVLTREPLHPGVQIEVRPPPSDRLRERRSMVSVPRVPPTTRNGTRRYGGRP
ncbi:inorganic diphosphatase [Streptomyces mayteni]